MMTQANPKKGIEVAGAAYLRRHIRTETNVRFLHNLPQFKPERALPDALEELLDRLDQAEKVTRFS